MTAQTVVENVACLGCGCACDDIGVVVRDGRIVEARNACHLGVGWFSDGQVAAACRVNGRDVRIPEAIASAATMLHEAKRPLVYIAPGLSCESQRAAVAVADVLGAHLDTVTSSTASAFVLAGQEGGWASATLGEIRNRADAVVFWGVDLEARYPRFASRCAPEPTGVHVPQGRASRAVIAVDIGEARCTGPADHRINIAPADELATIIALEALVRTAAGPAPTSQMSGAAWDNARALAAHLLAARYLALVYDAEPDDRAPRSSSRFAALTSLAQTLNERTRCAAIALRAGGNRSGAESVLVAQTGYPFAVDFTRGFPRYDPHGSSAARLFERGDVDMVLVVGDPSLVPSDIARPLAAAGHVVIGPGASALGAARVAIDTGRDGIHAGGTAFRTDDVPLPLRASLPGPPSAAGILSALAPVIRHLRRGTAFVVGSVARQSAPTA